MAWEEEVVWAREVEGAAAAAAASAPHLPRSWIEPLGQRRRSPRWAPNRALPPPPSVSQHRQPPPSSSPHGPFCCSLVAVAAPDEGPSPACTRSRPGKRQRDRPFLPSAHATAVEGAARAAPTEVAASVAATVGAARPPTGRRRRPARRRGQSTRLQRRGSPRARLEAARRAASPPPRRWRRGWMHQCPR